MAPNDTQSSLRPSMRRKSSAQNLLSSFKPLPASISAAPTPSTSGTTTPALSSHSHSPSPLPHIPSSIPAPLWTPTLPQQREWDAQSLHSDGTASALGSIGSPGASVEYLRDLVQKRIITLTYMRNVHDGRSHWFHTIMISRAELNRVFNNTAMKKRTYRFSILAISLATLFDISQPADLLRALLNTLTEYEQSKEEGERPKMRLWRRPPKRNAGVSDYALNIPEPSADTSYLTIPHMPFALDYTQTLLSLLDILSALYAKLAKLLGPSPFPHASQHMLGLSPHPGVSYLFQGGANPGQSDLWNVAVGAAVGGGMGSPPPSWTPALGELMLKVDGKFKKIISVLLKDLDAFARNGIKDELASLDPLLRNVGTQPWMGNGAEGRAVYEFEQ